MPGLANYQGKIPRLIKRCHMWKPLSNHVCGVPASRYTMRLLPGDRRKFPVCYTHWKQKNPGSMLIRKRKAEEKAFQRDLAFLEQQRAELEELGSATTAEVEERLRAVEAEIDDAISQEPERYQRLDVAREKVEEIQGFEALGGFEFSYDDLVRGVSAIDDAYRALDYDPDNAPPPPPPPPVWPSWSETASAFANANADARGLPPSSGSSAPPPVQDPMNRR